MNDEIGKITEEKQDYQEYVESFAHEIKIPIGALSLTFDNTKNYTLKKETFHIFLIVLLFLCDFADFIIHRFAGFF